MKILDRYIFRETFVPFLIALVALTFVAFSLFDIGRLLEVIVRRSATLPEIWAFSIAILPNVLTFTIPMAVLVGILTGFGRMSSDSEAIAFRASGVSMKRLMAPVLVLAVIAWIGNSALTMWVGPEATRRLRELEYQIKMKQVSLELQPRVFNENLQDRVLYVQDISPDGMAWHGIMLADLSKPDDPRVIFAESASLVRDDTDRSFQLTLTNGNMHVVSPLSPNRYDFSPFGTRTLRIAMPVEPPPPAKVSGSETPTQTLWNAVQSGTATYEDAVEFHRRLALPFACLAFALVGLPLGVSTTRGSKSMGLVLSLVLMLIYYMSFIGGTRIAGNAQFSPFFGAWLPNLAFALLGVVLLTRGDREYENQSMRRLGEFVNRLTDRITSAKPSRKRLTRWAYSLTHHPKFFRLLDIYVLRGFWFFFALVLTVFVSLFIIVTWFQLLPHIVKNNIDSSIVVSYFIYLIPFILYHVVPLTVLLAILINLGTLTKTNEILAVKAGAISLYRMTWPLLLMGLLVSAGIYVVQDFMLPYSNQRQDEYLNVIKGRAPQTYRDPHRKWMVGSGDRMYHYNYFEPEQNLFGGFSIFAFRPNTFDLTEWVYATRASWNGSAWSLEDGWIRRLNQNGKLEYQEFTQQEFERIDNPDYFKKEVRTASQMTYSELRSYVQDLQQSGFDVSTLTVDLYRKLSFPLVSFIMAVIGIPFSFTTGKKGAFYGIGLCIAVGIFYWSTFELFEKLGGINRLSPLIAAWFPNLIFGFGGMWMMLRVKT
ncbi:MAG: LPS export ABC transporter permease LptF [Acidobacteria bacterium]|nr:LPS export ABC transporter permease LptF [Acidobacteriota bacterium]